MAQTAFFLKDLFDGNLAAGSGFTADLPGANASLDSPGLQAKQIEGTSTTGTFEIGSTNKWFDIDEGSGDVAVAIADGQYTQGPDQLAALIATTLTAAAGLAGVFTVQWLFGTFVISSTVTFSLSWKTGSHGTDNSDNSIAEEIGFDESADTSTAAAHTGTSKRYSTGTSLLFDLGSAKEINAFLWQADGGSDGATVSFDNVVAYVDTNIRGFHRDAWVDASSTAITISGRPPSTGTNLIQAGFQDPATSVSKRWAFVSWRHWDESNDHRIGLCKAFASTWDTTNSRTISPLREHRPIDGSAARNVANYYPPGGILRWRASMAFEQWEVASWRLVFVPIVQHGKQTGALWVEDFETLKANTIATTKSEAVAGLALWGTFQSFDGGDAGGQQDAYRTSALSFEQLP